MVLENDFRNESHSHTYGDEIENGFRRLRFKNDTRRESGLKKDLICNRTHTLSLPVKNEWFFPKRG